MRWLAILAIGACGRIEFDPLGGDAGIGIDDAGLDAAPDATPLACDLTNFVCPTGRATICGTTCFATCETNLTWAEGQDLCLAWGGNLALLRRRDQRCVDRAGSGCSGSRPAP